MRAASSGLSERAVRRLAPPEGKGEEDRRKLGAGSGIAPGAGEQLQFPEGVPRDEFGQHRAVLGRKDDDRARGDDVEPVARVFGLEDALPFIDREELGLLSQEVQLLPVESRKERSGDEDIGRARKRGLGPALVDFFFHEAIVARISPEGTIDDARARPDLTDISERSKTAGPKVATA